MEKKFYDFKENKLSYGRGYVYSLQYHLVWCTKYRRKVLINGADVDCKKLLQELAQEYQFQILAMEVMPDHIHMLIDAKPQFFIPDMIKIMKGGIARKLFLLHPEMKKKLWGGHLWNPSYCAVTVSDRSRKQVEHYIESQKEKEWGGPGKAGRPPKDLEKLQAYHREVLHEDHVELQSGDTKTSYASEEDHGGDQVRRFLAGSGDRCRVGYTFSDSE